MPHGIRGGLFSYLPYSLSATVHQRRYPGGTQKRDTTKIKNCGAVLSNEVEYEPSVYIEATDSAKYPWLSFVVTGEQLTMTQVSFAIYALYLPTKDSQCTQAVDTIEQNQKYQNRLITLKQAQNPKIKNYIESINEILISGLEAWLNNNNTSSMYD